MWKHPSVLNLISEYNNPNPIEIVKSLTRTIILEAFSKGWTGPPFNPIELAQMQNLEVMPNDAVRDARILSNRRKLRIEYNPNQRQTRINFSIAHEIGHTFFSDCGETIRNREKKLEIDFNELEFLCDIIAAEILLPYAEFSNEANSVPLNLDSLLKISDKYNASLSSVFLRFCEVVDKSCAMIICSLDENNNLITEYSKKSHVSNLQIPRDYQIPNQSKSFECQNPGWTSYGIENWDIMGETNYHVYSIGLAPVKNSRKKRIGIFLVPEFYKTEPVHRIQTVFGDATEPRGSGMKIIGQVVNTYAGLGAGFGKAMKKKYPKTQQSLSKWKSEKTDFKLGNSRLIQITNELYVFQMLAQQGLFPTDKNPLPLKYDALRKCLKDLAEFANELKASVHLPLIGAGQAKGSWHLIEGIIFDEIVLQNINVTIYILPGTKLDTSRISSLSSFNEKSIYESK